MNDFAIEKLNSFGNDKVSNDVIEWLDNNNEVVINNSLDNVLQDMFSKDDYATLCEAFEYCFDWYEAVSFEDLMEDKQIDMEIAVEKQEFEYLEELSTGLQESEETNGSGSMFADGCNIFDTAIRIDDFIRFLKEEEY